MEIEAGAFGASPLLLHLNLNNNLLRIIPCTLPDGSQFGALKYLNLAQNEIVVVPASCLPSTLEDLHLEKNPPLQQIAPGALRGLTNLNKIELSDGNLTVLDDGVFSSELTSLRLIYLRGNPLVELHRTVLAALP